MGNELIAMPLVRTVDPAILNALIEAEAVAVAFGESNLSRSYARLGCLLARFKAEEAWRALGLTSFNRYLLSIHERYGRSTQQLYSYVAVAEKLLPYVSEADLNNIGVTKGLEVVRASNRAQKPPTPELIAAALDENVGVNEIKALAHRVYELGSTATPKGSWLDIGGFYVDSEQRKTFTEAVKLTMKLLNLPPEMPDWLKRQRVILAWAAEFSGTHAAEVYGPPAQTWSLPTEGGVTSEYDSRYEGG